LGQRGEAAAFQIELDQRRAAVVALLGRRVVAEDEALAVGSDVEVVDAGVGARQLVGRALEQVAHRAGLAVGAGLQQVQVHDAAHRQVAVPVAVLRFAGGVAGFLALGVRLVAIGLRLAALGIGPDPAQEHQALAVGHPAKALHAGGHGGGAARLAAIGGDEVELRRLVLVALLLALRGEGDEVATRAPARRAVLVAAGRERARLAAQRRQQPQLGGALVLVHRVARQRGHGLRAVGAQAGGAEALELPEVVDGEQAGALLLCGHGLPSGRGGLAA
jgi:hypothetical protein